MNERRSVAREIVAAIWQQPLWAVPFALFFGLIYAPNWRGLLLSYKISLTFAYCIRLGLLAAHWTVVHRLLCRIPDWQSARPIHYWTPGLWYTAGALLGTALAALLANWIIFPGLLGSTRAVLLTFFYSLIFTALFLGVNYAIVFYRQAVERARAVEQVRAELAQAELRALRAQIQPHFLFNTLNTIAALIAEDPRAAEDTVTRLAETFRYVLACSGQEHAPLASELSFVRDVLAIERRRVGERLRIVEEVEPGLDGVLVPTLLLQPLVENAVRHGPGSRPEGGTICIAGRRGKGTILLEVRDDGPGFDPGTSAAGTGFGLHSVRERLRALGPPHALEVQSGPGRGTTIRLTLPVAPSRTPGGTGEPH